MHPEPTGIGCVLPSLPIVLQLSVNGTVDVAGTPANCTPVGLVVAPTAAVSERGREQQAVRPFVPVRVKLQEQFVAELLQPPEDGAAVTFTVWDVEPEGAEAGAWYKAPGRDNPDCVLAGHCGDEVGVIVPAPVEGEIDHVAAIELPFASWA